MDWHLRLLGPRDSDLAEWSEGRVWWYRLPLLAYTAWLLLAAIDDPDRQTLFGGLNLGIHEAGHLLTGGLGQFICAAMGSGAQCLAPIVAGAMLLWKHRDFTGIFFCLCWLGVNGFEVARYMADASAMAMPLVSVGGGDVTHDFNYIFDELGLLGREHIFANLLRFVSYVCLAGGITGQAWTMWVMRAVNERRGA